MIKYHLCQTTLTAYSNDRSFFFFEEHNGRRANTWVGLCNIVHRFNYLTCCLLWASPVKLHRVYSWIATQSSSCEDAFTLLYVNYIQLHILSASFDTTQKKTQENTAVNSPDLLRQSTLYSNQLLVVRHLSYIPTAQALQLGHPSALMLAHSKKNAVVSIVREGTLIHCEPNTVYIYICRMELNSSYRSR